MKDSILFTTFETSSHTAEENSRYDILCDLFLEFEEFMMRAGLGFARDNFGNIDINENFLKFLDVYDGEMSRLDELKYQYDEEREQSARDYQDDMFYQMAI